MFARKMPFYLLAGAVAAAASAFAGQSLGAYATGDLHPAYTRQAVELTPPEAPSPSRFTRAAADLTSQWPVGSPEAEARYLASAP